MLQQQQIGKEGELFYYTALLAALAPGSPGCPLYIYGTVFRNMEYDTRDFCRVFPVAERALCMH